MTDETSLEESRILTAEELTRMVDDKDVKVIGFYDHKKASERYVVWLLITVDDGQVLGEKAVVTAFASENAARMAMRRDIDDMAVERGFEIEDVVFANDECYASTRDGRHSWCVEQAEVRRE